MATQSAPPPNATDQKPQRPDFEIGQPENVDQQNARDEPVKQNSTTSVFVNSQPRREEQVQNAVKFLSHPKVRGSPVMYRRSFLEKKGLTKEEIDEAFRRVPDSPPTVQTAGVNQDGQLKPSPDIQQQAQPQTLQPGAPASTGSTSSLGTLSRSRFHWYHALIGVGLLAACGAGTAVLIKNSIIPQLKSWICKVVLEEDDQLKRTELKPTIAEEAAQAAKAAAAAAANLAKASQEMLASKNEERRCFEEFVSLLDKQVQEMKLMTNAIRRLEGQLIASSGASLLEQEDRRLTQTSSKKMIMNGKMDYDSRSVRSLSPPASVLEPSTTSHTKSYMEIMAMVQRGEKPMNIREINDSPLNPNQQPSNPRLAPKTKPWEVGQLQNTSTQVFQSQVNGEELNFKVQETIQSNGETPAPWWQRKSVKIREINDEDEHRNAPSSQLPVQRVWVPPQPPPIAMPEAAEAIRRPKPVSQKEQAPDDQSVAHSSDLSDEVQRIPRTSESNGAAEGPSGRYGEIQEAPEVKHEEK